MNLNLNLQDGKLHTIGFVGIENVVVKVDDPMAKVDVTFNGGEFTLDVPKNFIMDGQGQMVFHEGDVAFIELQLGIQSETKTFQGNAYSRIGIKIKRVVAFRRPTNEEQKQL